MGEPRDIDFCSPLAGHVVHVEDEDCRQPEIEHLADEEQIPLEIGRVDDAQDGVDSSDIGLASQEHVDRDHFVRRTGGQTVGSRQIDEPHRRLADADAADFFLDRHARIIPHVGLHARERIEQRALARVRIADQCDGDRAGLSGGGAGRDMRYIV